MIRNKKVIVTGGLGFIGSHLVEALCRDNEVTIIDDSSSGNIENIRHLPMDDIRVVDGSITSPDLAGIFQGHDYVFHEAARASVPGSILDPLGSADANIRGTLNVLMGARDTGIKNVVFASSSSVYGNSPAPSNAEDLPLQPLSPYAVTKAAGELYCKAFHEAYGLQTTSLRYFNVFGPRQDPMSQYAAVIPRFITAMMRDERPVVYGDGEQSRDFTYVKHIVDANIHFCTAAESGPINIACGRSITINQLIEMVNDVLGKDIKPLYVEPRPGDIKHSLADISRARSYNYEPKGDFREELNETIRWFISCKN